MKQPGEDPGAGGGLAVVLLAAGRGRRFRAAGGRGDKLLQPLPDGRAVALAAAQNLRRAWPDEAAATRAVRWLAVVPPLSGAADARAAQALRHALAAAGWQLVEAAGTDTESDAGMGHSLAAGVRAAPQASGWLVALADMPYLQRATLRLIAAQPLDPTGIVAPRHQGRRGHPVRFGAAYGDELQALRGDLGARDLLQRHAAAVRLLDVDDPGVLRDVDTPDDLGAR